MSREPKYNFFNVTIPDSKWTIVEYQQCPSSLLSASTLFEGPVINLFKGLTC